MLVIMCLLVLILLVSHVNGKVLTWVVTNITTSVPLVITVDVNVTKAGTWDNNLTIGNRNYTVNVTTIVGNKTVNNPTPVVSEILSII